jgi:hypothetical protein
MIIKFMLLEPRPFWESVDILCTIDKPFDYAAPNNKIFGLIFFWSHYIYNSLYKYAEVPHKKLIWFLAIFISLYTVLLIFN